VGIAEEKRSCVHEGPAFFLRLDRKRPENRRCERFFDRTRFGRTASERAITLIWLDQEYPRSDSLEANQVGAAHLAAIESDRIRSDAGGERDLINQLEPRAGNLEEKFPRLFLPVER
jgi:hypothetical protein